MAGAFGQHFEQNSFERNQREAVALAEFVIQPLREPRGGDALNLTGTVERLGMLLDPLQRLGLHFNDQAVRAFIEDVGVGLLGRQVAQHAGRADHAVCVAIGFGVWPGQNIAEIGMLMAMAGQLQASRIMILHHLESRNAARCDHGAGGIHARTILALVDMRIGFSAGGFWIHFC